MKHLYLMLLFVSTLSVSQESRLTIFSEDGEAFYLFLNSIRQNEEPVVNIAVDYLTNDYYDAKIVFANESINQIEKNILWLWMQMETVANLYIKLKTAIEAAN